MPGKAGVPVCRTKGPRQYTIVRWHGAPFPRRGERPGAAARSVGGAPRVEAQELLHLHGHRVRRIEGGPELPHRVGVLEERVRPVGDEVGYGAPATRRHVSSAASSAVEARGTGSGRSAGPGRPWPAATDASSSPERSARWRRPCRRRRCTWPTSRPLYRARAGGDGFPAAPYLLGVEAVSTFRARGFDGSVILVAARRPRCPAIRPAPWYTATLERPVRRTGIAPRRHER